MTAPKPLFDLNPQLDPARLAALYERELRVQVADVLTPASAATLHEVLERYTDWGLGWQAGGAAPGAARGAELRAMPAARRDELGITAAAAAKAGDFAFLYARYPMLDAYLGKWHPDHPLDLVLEHINSPPLLELVRAVTGDASLIKADAQATLFAPGHFLTSHDDSVAGEGRRVAYVLNLTRDWRPDWGGYLLFYNDDGEVVAGFRPRFNALNLFRVPQRHSVTYVPPFAPVGRYAITGWFRDR